MCNIQCYVGGTFYDVIPSRVSELGSHNTDHLSTGSDTNDQ